MVGTVQSYQTILQEVQFACRTMPIPVPAQVYSSSDENALLMGQVINQAGEMVLSAYPWQQFQSATPFTINGDGSTTLFDIPDDYHRLVDDTGWSTAMRRPCNLITNQDWALMSAWVSNSFTLTPVFRLINNQFQFFNAPALGDVITFQYIRKNWVSDADTPATLKAFCTKDGDTPLFDWLLMVLALKVKWREIKGFDSAADTRDFQSRLTQLTNKDIPGQVLSLNGGSPIGGLPLITINNVPITGYGN